MSTSFLIHFVMAKTAHQAHKNMFKFIKITFQKSIVVPVGRSMKYATLTLYEKHNIENKWPNIQAQNKSKSIGRCQFNKTMLFGQIFFVLKVSNNHSCCLLIEGFCFLSLLKKRSGILYSWVNEKWIVQKINLSLQLYITEIEHMEMGKSKRPIVVVVEMLGSQSRGPRFKTAEWLQGQHSLSSFRD